MPRFYKNLLFVIFCIILAIGLNFSYEINSDEGLILNGAWNLYNGKIIYKDFYEFFGPASLSLINFVFIIFSPSYYSSLFFSIAFLLISAYYLYRISIIIFINVFWAKVSAVSWIILASIAYPIINHNVFSTFLTIIFTYFFLNLINPVRSSHGVLNPVFAIQLTKHSSPRQASGYSASNGIKTKKEINGVMAGIIGASIFYFLQTKGIALILVISIFLIFFKNKKIITKKNTIYFYIAYFFSILLGITVWGFHPFLPLLNIGTGYLQNSYHQLSLLPFFIFLTIFLLIVLILYLKKTVNVYLGLLIVIQIGLIISMINLPDIFHILINSFPILILVIYLFKFLKFNKHKVYFIINLGLAIALITFALLLKNFRTTLNNKVTIQEIKKIIGTEKIFSFPFLPNMYFELKKKNPYLNSFFTEKLLSLEQFENNLKILKEENPKYIITDYHIVEKYNHAFSNPIDLYLRDHYLKIRQIGSIDIWEKNTNSDLIIF